jgi:hypothetical protein
MRSLQVRLAEGLLVIASVVVTCLVAEPAKLLAIFVADTNDTKLTTNDE